MSSMGNKFIAPNNILISTHPLMAVFSMKLSFLFIELGGLDISRTFEKNDRTQNLRCFGNDDVGVSN